MQGLRNPEKRGVHSRTPQGRGMSVPQPFGYAQGREPVERQMVFDGQSGVFFLTGPLIVLSSQNRVSVVLGL